MLKLEPREADRLPVPAPALVEAAAPARDRAPGQVSALLRGGKRTEAAKLVDNVLLVGELGMSRADVRVLRDAHEPATRLWGLPHAPDEQLTVSGNPLLIVDRAQGRQAAHFLFACGDLGADEQCISLQP